MVRDRRAVNFITAPSLGVTAGNLKCYSENFNYSPMPPSPTMPLNHASESFNPSLSIYSTGASISSPNSESETAVGTGGGGQNG